MKHLGLLFLSTLLTAGAALAQPSDYHDSYGNGYQNQGGCYNSGYSQHGGGYNQGYHNPGYQNPGYYTGGGHGQPYSNNAYYNNGYHRDPNGLESFGHQVNHLLNPRRAAWEENRAHYHR